MVSTCVGGIPEVLPEEMIQLAEPSVDGKQTGILYAFWYSYLVLIHISSALLV